MNRYKIDCSHRCVPINGIPFSFKEVKAASVDQALVNGLLNIYHRAKAEGKISRSKREFIKHHFEHIKNNFNHGYISVEKLQDSTQTELKFESFKQFMGS